MTLLIVTAGCTTLSSDGTQTTTEQTETQPEYTTSVNGVATTQTTNSGGKLLAYSVSTPPENVTVVNYTNTAIGNSTVLTKALRQAVEDGDAALNLEPSELKSVDKTLEDVPRYDGAEFGYYIRYDETIVQVRTVRY